MVAVNINACYEEIMVSGHSKLKVGETSGFCYVFFFFFVTFFCFVALERLDQGFFIKSKAAQQSLQTRPLVCFLDLKIGTKRGCDVKRMRLLGTFF